MNDITVLKMLEVDQKMVLEVASGIRDPAEIAFDYGYTAEQWEKLKEFDPFKKAVEAKKTELTASGYTFRMKAALGAEDLLAEVYKKATTDDVSFHTQLEALKFMARAAGLDSPPRKETDEGNRFSITINLGGGKSIEIGGDSPVNALDDGAAEPYYTNFSLPMGFDTDLIDIPFDSSVLFAEYGDPT